MFQQRGDLTFFSFDSFRDPNMPVQAMSIRRGGVSGGVYWSLNLGLHVEDDKSAVLTNRERFCQALSIPLESLVIGQQVHGTGVAVVRGGHRGKGARRWEEGLPQTDAMVTDSPDVALMILVADCAAVILYDPARKAVGIAHGSWRGTAGRIGLKAVLRMVDAFGCRPEDIQAAISPSIGPCCYEVGGDVLQALRKSFPSTWEDYITSHRSGAVHFDLWEALRAQLMEAGLREEKVEIAHICTACNTDLFYSHRREHGRTGRSGVIIALQRGAGALHRERTM